jgi:hypothetical protein
MDDIFFGTNTDQVHNSFRRPGAPSESQSKTSADMYVRSLELSAQSRSEMNNAQR